MIKKYITDKVWVLIPKDFDKGPNEKTNNEIQNRHNSNSEDVDEINTMLNNVQIQKQDDMQIEKPFMNNIPNSHVKMQSTSVNKAQIPKSVKINIEKDQQII